MEIRRCATLGGAAAVTALVLPGTALGASFTALKPCYVSLPGTNPQSENMNLAGTGFAPNVPVDIDVDGRRTNNGVPVDVSGALGADPADRVVAPSPFIAARERPFQVVASQNGQPVATGASRVTALNVALSPTRARPSRRITFRGRGFTGPGKVYAHYRFGGRTRATVTFTPKGPCGTFTTKRRQIPVANPRTGEWTVQLDQQKKYARTPASVYVRLTIIVSRVPRALAAQAETGGARVVAAGLGR